MVRKKWILGMIVIAASFSSLGCGGFDGPRQSRSKPRPDLPEYSIEEQKRRARDKYALPEDDYRTGPALQIDRPSPTGR